MELLINLGIVIVLLAIGYGFGKMAEQRHYKSIIEREKHFRDKVLVFSTRHLPPAFTNEKTTLVSGSVVISVDYFKRFIASLRLFFGGRVTTYEGLLDRGRREAILRMRENAHQNGAHSVFNVKLETASISKGAGNTIGSIEVYAYGTAICPDRSERVQQS